MEKTGQKMHDINFYNFYREKRRIRGHCVRWIAEAAQLVRCFSETKSVKFRYVFQKNSQRMEQFKKNCTDGFCSGFRFINNKENASTEKFPSAAFAEDVFGAGKEVHQRESANLSCRQRRSAPQTPIAQIY